MADTETAQEFKKIEQCKIKFNTEFNKENDDYIYLRVTVDNNLKDLLNLIACKTEPKTNSEFLSYNQNARDILPTIKRYKCKKWIWGSLDSNARELLLSVNLIDDGFILLPFENLNLITSITRDLKYSIENFLNALNKFYGYSESITYQMTRENEI